jgi:hypothetical protein
MQSEGNILQFILGIGDGGLNGFDGSFECVFGTLNRT